MNAIVFKRCNRIADRFASSAKSITNLPFCIYEREDFFQTSIVAALELERCGLEDPSFRQIFWRTIDELRRDQGRRGALKCKARVVRAGSIGNDDFRSSPFEEFESGECRSAEKSAEIRDLVEFLRGVAAGILPKRSFQIFDEFYFTSRTTKEIAARFGIKENTVWSHVSGATRRVREHLQERKVF